MDTSDTHPQFYWPEAASKARRILINPDAGYPLKHPVTTRVTLLLQVGQKHIAIDAEAAHGLRPRKAPSM